MKARPLNTRLALSTAQKGNQFVAEFVCKMRTLGDEMAAAGRPLEDVELVEYIITGLDEFFNPIVSALMATTQSMPIDELYSQVLAFETHLEIITGGGSSGSSANMALGWSRWQS